MKRFLCFTLTLVLLVLSLASCGKGNAGGDGTTVAPDTVYSTLQAFANANYSNMIVDVSSTQNGVTMKDYFVVAAVGGQTTVDYSCQRRSTFVNGVAPTDYLTTYRGSLVLENGKIVSQNGDTVSIDFTTLSLNALVFDASYFSDVEEGEGTFEAKVTNPAGFMNKAGLSVSDMTVSVAYSGMKTLTISYTAANGSAVVIEYMLF